MEDIAKLGKLEIGVRAQSVVVVVVSALWYVSVGMIFYAAKATIGNLNLFWNTVFWLGPFIAAILAVILVISHLRSDRRHSGWFSFAVLAAISQWYIIIFTLF